MSSTPNKDERILSVKKLVPQAILPAQGYFSDVGYDISIIRIIRPIGPGVTLYGTGLVIAPPEGFYVELVPRSSLCKTGWGFANSIGIIDPTYRGEVSVVLFRLHQFTQELELPLRVGQLVLRKLYILHRMVEVTHFRHTPRDIGGFGSTGTAPDFRTIQEDEDGTLFSDDIFTPGFQVTQVVHSTRVPV
jgi:dUTP pyrophosphatase